MQDAAVQPSLVVVYFGGNDSMAPHPSGLGPHVPLTEYVENMKKIALHLQVTSFLWRILICLIFRMSVTFLKAISSGNFFPLKTWTNGLSSVLSFIRAFQTQPVSYFLVALQWTRPKFARTKGDLSPPSYPSVCSLIRLTKICLLLSLTKPILERNYSNKRALQVLLRRLCGAVQRARLTSSWSLLHSSESRWLGNRLLHVSIQNFE